MPPSIIKRRGLHRLAGLLAGLLGCLPGQCLAQPTVPGAYCVGQSAATVCAIVRAPAGAGASGGGFAAFYLAHHSQLQAVPYGSGGKGSQAGQTLINLEQMDCLTFVENLLALYLTQHMLAEHVHHMRDAEILERYKYVLDHIRYDRGVNCRWEDRLFYFTQAMEQLRQYGLVQDVAALNGEPYHKPISYMSTHRARYPGVQDWQRVVHYEQQLSVARRFYYPHQVYERYAELAQTGDIIAFASTQAGLDISHLGFVERDAETGGLRLTHSSSLAGRLVVGQDLCSYLGNRTGIEGFFVYRLTYP
ncbi:MAG: N-acetylmuramoyl-L-alanine amidase-like domain-containing protein [Sphingobacteriia bacterium]